MPSTGYDYILVKSYRCALRIHKNTLIIMLNDILISLSNRVYTIIVNDTILNI